MPAMPIIPPPLGFGVFFAAIVVSRIIQERALRKLSTADKGRLVEAFAGVRMLGLVPLAAIAGLYLVMTGLDVLTVEWMLAIYLPAVLLFSLGLQVFVHRKLRALDLDPAYLRAHMIGRAIVLLGCGTMLLAL